MIYASRNEFYKAPFGAVRAGESVLFNVTPQRGAVRELYLCVNFEFGNNQYSEYKMLKAEPRDNIDIFSVTLDTKDLLGPVWYWFRCVTESGHNGFYDNPGNLDEGECACVDNNPRPYQLTVTHKDPAPIPDWYGKGVTYHIFPDRFAYKKSKTPPLAQMPGNRILHEDWSDCPDFLPDEHGEVLNRDFFGGNIAGIIEKLPYIASLGTKTIFLNPIFEAASNHRYDTASYERIDPLFGTEEEFIKLCKEAKKLDIRILLDGVYNHTGYNSEYFNGRGFYKTIGAAQSKDSKYYDWFCWQEWPEKYDSWWGIYTLPQVDESNPDYKKYMLTSKNSIVRRWLKAGASGWRLDVADELPGEFIETLRKSAKIEKEDAVIIGEVWEDASNKISYDVRRRYLLGRELDGVMNYPLRDSLIGFILGGDAFDFKQKMETLREHYPRAIYHNLMNALGTHDTPRILTVFGATPEEWAKTKAERAETFLPPERLKLAKERLKLAISVLFTFPGSPTVYYGDEAGLEGFEDPFNRRGYPWGGEDDELLKLYKLLGKTRSKSELLQSGDIKYIKAAGGLLCYERYLENLKKKVLVCVNRSDEPTKITSFGHKYILSDIFTKEKYRPDNGELSFDIEPMTAMVLI